MLSIVLAVINGCLIYLYLCRHLAARLSEMRPEQQRLAASTLGVVLLMGWYTMGLGLFATDLPQSSVWSFNILVVGVWALMVWARYGRR